MAEPFIGEIRIMPYHFAPKDWAFCNGQIMEISQHMSLYAIITSIYGGDGRSTFALPNLQGRAPIHPGIGPGLSYYREGQSGGVTGISLNSSQLPSHDHDLKATVNLDENKKSNTPDSGKMIGLATKQLDRRKNYTQEFYGNDEQTIVPMSSQAISTVGQSAQHENRQPYLGVNFCIALEGIFPART